MVGGLSGMALNCQASSLPDAVHDGRAVAVDDEAALLAALRHRRLGIGRRQFDAACRARSSMRTPPVARTTNWLPAGTDTISLVRSLACACALSPGR